MPRYFLYILVIANLSVCCALAQAAAAIEFAADIAPLFEAHCLGCHQPNILKGEFSLATGDDLKSSGHVVPGSPEASRLYQVIVDGEMPKDGSPLSNDEVIAIKQWIANGAEWPDSITLHEQSKADDSWWSLQPIADKAPPHADAAPGNWRVNPIDRFVWAMLEERGLRPSPQADRRTLIRRLYFDLIGLPPSYEVVRAFEKDDRPDAYERLVDDLLASPHYGERWAQHWLDIAHYADTHGFERDKRRDNAYRYRDYVIRSFNCDLPYDEFLRQQIAGDVLAPTSRDATIATGFLAAGPWDFVGQVETKSPALRRAARADDLDDMVTTVISATMGLTINCARCHDHKLDPITQEDYYKLTAVFAGTTRGDRVVDPEYERAQQRLAVIDRELARLAKSPISVADILGGGDGHGTGGKYPSGVSVQDGSRVTTMIGRAASIEANTFHPAADLPMVDGVFVPNGGEDVHMTVTSNGISIADLPATSGESWDHILNGPVTSQDLTVIDGVDYAEAPHAMIGIHANKGITFDLNAIREAHACGRLRFSATTGYGGKNEKTHADFYVYVDGKLRASRRVFGYQDGGQIISFDIDSDERFLTLIATDGGDGIGYDQVFFGDPYLEIYPDDITLTADEDRQKASLEAEQAKLWEAYPPDREPDLVFATRAIEPPETRILLRGNPEMPGKEVMPGALSCFKMLPNSFGENKLTESQRRAELSKWITHPSNPLTPRVWVNRLWHYHFATGIVDTPSDFGFGGGRPSHPDLLDWLASEFMRKGWSTKAMHRLIVTSQTYRQQSSPTPTTYDSNDPNPRDIDANNRLLWRANPRRLSAEALRDSVLHVSGMLNLKAFGPGYKDFEYREEYAPVYTYITADDPDQWRRSVYRFVVRSTPQPFMTTLDCPNPAVLTPDRLTTTTALQSLALLNNGFMLKQAGYFADRVREIAVDNHEEQIQHAFRLAFGRDPDASEYEDSAILISQHGLAALCRVLLNANEFVHID